MFKTCNVCGENKELTTDNFYRSRYAVDGFACTCRACEVQKTKDQFKPAPLPAPWKDVSEAYALRKIKAEEKRKRQQEILKALKQGHKECSKCDQPKRLFDFHINKKTFTGYDSWCKSCKKETVT
jgi:hypothetical protein